MVDVPEEDSQTCTVCNKPTFMRCSRCRNMWYCSPEHIHDDWPRHQKECNPLSRYLRPPKVNVNASPQPDGPELVTFSAIYFATKEDIPETVIVKCRPPPKGSKDKCPIPIIDGFSEGQELQPIVVTLGLNREPLRCPLQLWYSLKLLDDPDAPPNNSIFCMTRGVAERKWKGPVVVLKYTGTLRKGYCDATLTVLPALAAYFQSYE